MKHATMDTALEFVEKWNDNCYNKVSECFDGLCPLDLDMDTPVCYDTLMKLRALIMKYWDCEYPHSDRPATPGQGKD
jgi:hypothetical protein